MCDVGMCRSHRVTCSLAVWSHDDRHFFWMATSATLDAALGTAHIEVTIPWQQKPVRFNITLIMETHYIWHHHLLHADSY